VWPFQLLTPAGAIQGVHPIDWAADPQLRGAGARILNEVRLLREVCFCIGGTDIAQTVVRRNGFQQIGWMQYYVLPLRPLRQILTHPQRDWKLPARFVRNLTWRLRAANAPKDWSWQKLDRFPAEVLPSAREGWAIASRDPELLAYLVQCPAARYWCYGAQKNGRLAGYFVLTEVPGRIRIADLWTPSKDSLDWRALYAVAIQAALEFPEAAELSCCAANHRAQQAAEDSGFHPAGRDTVMAFDPRGLLAGASQLHLQMLENDLSYLHGRSIEYSS
jgi:hypothetical protein